MIRSLIGSKVTMCRYDKSSGKSSDKGYDISSAQSSAQSSDKGGDTLYKPIKLNKLNKPIKLNKTVIEKERCRTCP